MNMHFIHIRVGSSSPLTQVLNHVTGLNRGGLQQKFNCPVVPLLTTVSVLWSRDRFDLYEGLCSRQVWLYRYMMACIQSYTYWYRHTLGNKHHVILKYFQLLRQHYHEICFIYKPAIDELHVRSSRASAQSSMDEWLFIWLARWTTGNTQPLNWLPWRLHAAQTIHQCTILINMAPTQHYPTHISHHNQSGINTDIFHICMVHTVYSELVFVVLDFTLISCYFGRFWYVWVSGKCK